MYRLKVFIILSTSLAANLLWAAPSSPSSENETSTVSTQNQQEYQPHVALGFKEWKQKQVVEARIHLSDFKMRKSVDPIPQDGRQTSPQAIENKEETVKANEVSQQQGAEKLRQLEFNLEIALGLTIHDYFALYLKDKNRQEMAAAIQKLSPDELSELLISYRDSLYGKPSIDKKDGEFSSKVE